MGFLCLPCLPVLTKARSRANSGANYEEDESQERQNCNFCSTANGHVNTVALTALIILYLIFGAVIFQILESDAEHQSRAELKSLLRDFLADHQDCLKINDFEALLEKVSKLSSHGISPLKNVSAEPNWGFGQAFFFAGTLVSTVGYGHVSPVSQAGKAFTIAYCILGIPITLALLSAFVERMRIPSKWLLIRMNRGLGRLYSFTSVQYLHLFLLSSLILSLFLLIPSAIFCNIEPQWSFLDAFYYCFISLTTIGLGDYIPGDQPTQEHRVLYKILTTAYLLSGLCGMMLLLTTLYDIPSLNIERFLGMENQSTKEDEQIYLGSGKEGFGPSYAEFKDTQSKTETGK